MLWKTSSLNYITQWCVPTRFNFSNCCILLSHSSYCSSGFGCLLSHCRLFDVPHHSSLATSTTLYLVYFCIFGVLFNCLISICSSAVIRSVTVITRLQKSMYSFRYKLVRLHRLVKLFSIFKSSDSCDLRGR